MTRFIWSLSLHAERSQPLKKVGGSLLLLLALVLAACSSPVARAGNPLLGGNLNTVNDYSPDLPFTDLVKSSRQLARYPRVRDSGGINYVSANRNGDGWPSEDFSLVLYDGATPLTNGTYHMSFEGGSASTQIGTFTNPGSASIQNRTSSNGITTADIVLSGDVMFLQLDISNTGGNVRNLKVLQYGYNLSSYPTFTTRFTNYMSRFSTLRFMDWTQTNSSPVVNWSDRTSPDAPSQAETGRGIAWEYCIDLANQLGENMWINIPHQATNDYVFELGALFKQRLNPGHKVYIEYSNELWNYFLGSQYDWNNNQAANDSSLLYSGESSVPSYTLGQRRMGKRIKLIGDYFRAGWQYAGGSDPFPSVCCPVIMGQTSGVSTTQEGLSYIERTYGPPSNYLYASGGGGIYFQLQNDNPGRSTQNILDDLAGQVYAAPQNYGYDRVVATATWYGLRPMAYEGGPDVARSGNNIAEKNAALLSPGGNNNIRALDGQLLTNWYQGGGNLFMWYTAGSTTYDSQYAFWGLTNDLTNNPDSGQSLAMNDVLNANVPDVTAGEPVPGTIPAAHRVESSDRNAADIRYFHPPSTIDYLIRASSAGTYTIQLNVGGYNSGTTLGVQVNNSGMTQVTIPASGDLSSYVMSSGVQVYLAQGLNTIRISALSESIAWSMNQLYINSGTTTLSRMVSVNRTIGGTASASSNPVSAEVATYAFDGSSGSKWLGNMTSTGAWLQYQFGGGNSYAVTQYKITSGNDDYGRDPKAWMLCGSNDGTNWTSLNTQSNQTFSGRGVTNTYSLSNSTSYKYYRLKVTANTGSTETGLGGTGLLQIAELQLIG